MTTIGSGKRLSDRSVNFVGFGFKIRPLHDQIIIRPLIQQLSDDIDAQWRGEVVQGIVVATGPGCYPNIHKRGIRDGKPWRTVTKSKVFRATEVKIGDHVHLGGMELGGYLFPHVWFDGEWCVICTEKDIAVVRADY